MEMERLLKVNIEEEMKSAYIDYSMSVIVSRALPDVRDGLKPVHRRVLYGMWELGLLANRPYKKSARIVGEVLGKYHPHGDSSVYEAMVRMAQDWSLRYPLIDGQGNFGSIDGDSPAAMRYTEARLQKIAEEMLVDIEKNTVDFQLNFDDSLQEPIVLPSKIPNLLINGASGIAVGMATNMPPHNLSEIVDAIIAFIDNKDIATAELIKFVKGPDFPTGGIIYGEQGIRDAYETGRGRIIIRARTEIEHTHSGRECIVVNEIPFMVNKAEMIKRIADLINEHKIEGISYINDESDRNGMRIVIILKKDAASAQVVLNNLYKYTQLQTTFNVNNIALVKGRPKLLNLKELIENYVKHRHEIIIRRTRFELDQAEKRAHILEGLIIASDNIDEVIAIIKSSQNPDEARERLMERFSLSEAQARAIVDMRLRQLTGLEQSKLREEYNETIKQIDYLNKVLDSYELQMKIIKDELLEIKDKYGDKRRTEIIPNAEEFNPEDFYSDEEMVITISHLGYIKRTPLSEFRRQNRGGTGSKGSITRDEDFVEYLYIATMHNTMLFFTKKGKCYWLKVYNIPEGTKTSKGRAIQNLINIESDDCVKAFINVKNLDNDNYIKNNFIILCTTKGILKKTSLESYSRPRINGLNAITIREGDELIEARLTNGNHEIMLAVRFGRAIRFHERSVRPMGRTASGVIGIKLASETDAVIGMITIEEKQKDILVVSEKGYGKRTGIDNYRITNRGGKGVKTINITEKTGYLVALKDVTDNDDLMIITQAGNIVRIPVSGIRLMGRATQGVKLINLKENDSIASVACVEINEESEESEESEENREDGNNSSEEGKQKDNEIGKEFDNY
ncbi:MAG TPA: DNA gyrase subunit A [Bacteroidales bacterium]|nr:DNA gyrase subunit A [Bacteroidales bacterium]HOU95640.1 DNA gyrase subunit A [Bacteroidales bacterium]HQG36035.1 DNA gyrase subunit A [Bacteroidales bacterium]HQG52797.1 DNA gyrase subunit A [Bacteroidales bacterium]HQJ20351.1 DNA gyrase subunit A [Bacteroidales bacterium]